MDPDAVKYPDLFVGLFGVYIDLTTNIHSNIDIVVCCPVCIGANNKQTFLYIWDMEEKILYPGEDIQPIEVGEGYREYWLSDVVKSHGAFVKMAKIGVHWRDGWAACELKIGRIVEGQWEFLWRGDITTPIGFVVHPEARRFIEDGGAHNWTDVRLRYMFGDDGVLHYPNFVAARHIWDYASTGKHVDAFVDFATGEHRWNISSL